MSKVHHLFAHRFFPLVSEDHVDPLQDKVVLCTSDQGCASHLSLLGDQVFTDCGVSSISEQFPLIQEFEILLTFALNLIHSGVLGKGNSYVSHHCQWFLPLLLVFLCKCSLSQVTLECYIGSFGFFLVIFRLICQKWYPSRRFVLSWLIWNGCEAWCNIYCNVYCWTKRQIVPVGPKSPIHTRHFDLIWVLLWKVWHLGIWQLVEVRAIYL